MTIRTNTDTAFALDAGDFQFSYAGVTVGLKLSYYESPVGEIASASVVEKTGAEWVLKKELVGDFSAEVVKNMGVSKWLTDLLLPRLNAWLAERFGAPVPVPDWVPQAIVDLDAAMRGLKVTTVNGIPQVTL